MNPADDREVALFREALQRVAGPERQAFLDQACAGDPALRSWLEALLQAHESAGPFLEPLAAPQGTGTVVVHPEEGPGTVIGRYKLLEQIGEGGCGAVYMAEQEAPMRRRVALKIIKLGMDTKQVVARFEAERRALALMGLPASPTSSDFSAAAFDSTAIGRTLAQPRPARPSGGPELRLHYFPPKCECTNEGRNSFTCEGRETTRPTRTAWVPDP